MDPFAMRSDPIARLPDEAALARIFRLRYGPKHSLEWAPRLRARFGYHPPDDVYVALVDGLVDETTAWLDVGCGRALFPFNAVLSEMLSKRCARLVGVDPDATLRENRWVHEKVGRSIDQYDGQGAFDLVTMRMVAEHIEDPAACVAGVARALRPGGLAVVYTVFSASPMPLLTRLAPMRLRRAVKSWLWRTPAEDSFATRYRMNTRSALRRQFAAEGMREEAFCRLDDCRTFARFPLLVRVELTAMRACRALGVPYPEHCLLGVYQR